MNLIDFKRKFPRTFNFLRKVYGAFKNREINNYFTTNYQKTALLSYITYPFARSSDLAHTNSYEAISHAQIMKELGYNVDVIDYDSAKIPNFLKYDLLVGFGDAFQKYFESGCDHMKTIYYGTGMHVCYANHATLGRVRDVHTRKGKWLCKSSRFVDKTWTHQTLLVDGMIVLGNDVSKQSYTKFYNGIVRSVPAPFYKVLDGREILAARDLAINKSFLWFGSSGLIHKGLDLVLDFFSKRPDLTLHVCGPIDGEPDFKNVYSKELCETKNILNHGFIDISSVAFAEILRDCSFLISPSCSEGGAAGTLNAIGNGALIPIVTKETTISTGHQIWINELTEKGIKDAVEMALGLSSDEVLNSQGLNLDYVLRHHSKETYYNELKQSYKCILGSDK